MMTKRGPGGIGKVGHLGQSDLISLLASSIQRMEGWHPGSVSYRNNNPGNLRPIPGGWPGQVGVDAGGYAVFDSFTSGQAALETQIQRNIDRGLTLDQFFAGRGSPGDPDYYAGYAPAADRNEPNLYASNVATWTGIDPSVPLSSLVSSSGVPSGADSGAVSEDSGDGGDGGLNPLIIGLVAAGAALLWMSFRS